MSDSRIQRLSQLFESKNRILRTEAAQQLAQFPLTNESLRQTLRKQFSSSLWESRTSAAYALGLLLERLSRKIDRKQPNFKNYEPEKLQNLDLDNIITHYKILVSCEEIKIDGKSKPTKLSNKEQRRLVDQHLDLNAQTGISSRFFIGDDDFTEAFDQAEASTSSPRDEKEELSNSIKSESQDTNSGSTEETEAELSVRLLSEFLAQLLCDLASASWQERHGASMAICQIVTYALPMISQQNIELIAIRIIQVLALDRFNDFVTGSNAVAPVRESVSQALSMLMLKIGTDSPLVSSIIGQLQVLLLMGEEKNWPCRQTSLIVLKYFFSMCSSSQEFSTLFSCAVEAMNDQVDEVVSTAVHAVSSLFANEKIDAKDKNQMIGVVMKIVWRMLLEGENLLDDVSSLLNDLLGIVQTWLCVETDSFLNANQFQHIVNLFDPTQITTTIRAMECVFLALSKANTQLGNEEIFLLIKMLYRCLLFVQVSDSQRLIDLAFTTLSKLTSIYDEARSASMEQLQTTIGLWIGCLSYDYKNFEIDVFIHNVDGPFSSHQQPEAICGEEARFLDISAKPNVFMDRKCVAARFLSPIIDVLYRSTAKIQDQPLHLSLQLHFIPYLRTNSLHQRLGVAIVLNCWARMFRRAYNAQKQQEYPTLLVQVLETILNEANTQRAMYDEVALVIGTLTNECNEFRRNCIQKGVPQEECPAIENTPNMEQVVESLYESCKRRLKKPADLEALDGRRNYLIQLINATKLEIRTNTNRLNCLCASALFYLGHMPTTLTPLIRPLIDSTETEDNERLAEECFYDSFAILFAATLQRQPCPHAKILKQLATGLQQDDNFMPKSAAFTETSSGNDVEILSVSSNPPSDKPTTTKTKNCQSIIRQLGQQFGTLLFQVCPELSSYVKLDGIDLTTDQGLETFLCNIEFRRLLAATTEHRPTQTEITLIIQQCSSPNAAIRFRVSRFLSELASIDLCFVLNSFYYPVILEGSRKIDDQWGRAGAIEFLSLVTQKLNANQLIAVASLLAPQALALISDNIESIRELAAQAFGRLVSLLHLQSSEDLALLSEPLQKQLKENKDFVNVLSAPSRLQPVPQTDIPGLSKDITLRAYQLEGITWLTFLSRFYLNGILGDDMGLGKTLQTLSLLAIERHKEPKAPTLIVCPRTLTTHWTKEWHNYFPEELEMLKFGDSNCEQPSKLAKTDRIIVTSYEELRANVKKFNSISWKYIVLDEGHCIRNPNTQMFEAITSLRAQHKLLLSGTPVQNSPADLWALFRFLMPGYLFTQKQFHSKFLKPILACRNAKASDQQTKEGEQVLSQLHRLILPFVLRRLKSDVLKELPDKVVQECSCQLTEVQAALYTAIVEKCTLIKSEDGKPSDDVRLSPLHTLIALRQLVDHPIMIRDVLKKINWTNKRIFDPDSQQANNIEFSGKLIALRELLSECQIGDQPTESTMESTHLPASPTTDLPELCEHRALIFCQWRASVDLIAHHLNKQSLGLNIKYLRLDGTVPPNERQAVVDRFNNDPSIDLLLVTTHIGGVGLTLTGADVVIFMDHDWNPVKDLQAVDRAHRLGQTKTVNVYRLITQATIEEKIMRFQKFKLDTANALVGADNRSISSMATDELLELFNLDGAQTETSTTNTTDEPASKKRRRKATDVANSANPEMQFSMQELWDESQYADQHSIKSFMEKTGL